MVDIARLGIEVDSRQVKKASKELSNLGDTGKKVSDSLGSVSTVFKTIVTSMAVAKVVQYADAMSLVEGRLKLVTSSSAELAKVQKELFDISQRSRSSFTDTADLYTRLARSTKDLGLNQSQLMTITETISKSMVVSGASAEEAGRAVFQLSQAFMGGTLRAEEYNSIIDQAPRLLQAMADATGKSMGELRQAMLDGKISSEVMAKSLLSQSDTIQNEFSQMPQTVGQSLVMLENSFMSLVSQMDKSSSFSSKLSNTFASMANSMTDNADNLSHGLTFSLAVVERMGDQFNLLAEFAEFGAESIAFSFKSLFSKLSTEFYENLYDIGFEMSKLGMVSKESLDNILLSLNMSMEETNSLAREQIKNYNEVKDALDKANPTVEERVALMYSEHDALKKINDEKERSKEIGETGGVLLGGSDERMEKLEEEKKKVLEAIYPVDSLQAQYETHMEKLAEFREYGLMSENEYQQALLTIRDQYTNEQLKLESQKTQRISDMQRGVAQEAANLLSALGKDNKAAAIASIAIQKGLAIASTQAHTATAAMLAYSSQLIPGDPTSIARAEAAAASTWNLGQMQIGLIAATGLVQAGQTLSGGGSSAGGYGGTTTSDTPYSSYTPVTNETRAEAVTKEVTINIGDDAFIRTDMVRELVSAINEELGDGVKIIL